MDSTRLLTNLAIAALLTVASAMPGVAQAQQAPASAAPGGCALGLHLIDGWCEPRAVKEPAPAGEGAPEVRLAQQRFVNMAVPAGQGATPAALIGCAEGLHLIDGWCEPRATVEPAPAGEGAPALPIGN